MVKDIYLFRHGEIEYPLDEQGRKLVYPSETPLSALGILQIQKTSEELRKRQIIFEALFISPFKRAMQSAEIIASGLQVNKMVILPDLSDVNPNSWIGCPLQECIDQTRGDIYSHPKSADQETLEHLIMRARRGIKQVFNEKSTINGVVSHGDLISAMMWGIVKPDEHPTYERMRDNFYLQKGQVAQFKVDNDLRLVGEVSFIAVSEVALSAENYRGH